MTIDTKEFWEEKLIGWEDGRYGNSIKNTNWLERIANKASASLRYRIEITKILLSPHVKGKKIVEIGCGSGLLTKTLYDAGAKSYVGYDIAELAISNAIKISEKEGTSKFATYKVCSVEKGNRVPAQSKLNISLERYNEEELF